MSNIKPRENKKLHKKGNVIVVYTTWLSDEEWIYKVTTSSLNVNQPKRYLKRYNSVRRLEGEQVYLYVAKISFSIVWNQQIVSKSTTNKKLYKYDILKYGDQSHWKS